MGNRTIVYVEDEPDYQKLVSRIVGSAGFPIEMADNGKDGMKLIERQKPSLLILDINLPDTDGFSICRQLREEEVWKDLCILMLTVRQKPEEWLKGFSSGANDYVSKPLNPPEFLERVRNCAEGKTNRPIIGPEEAEFQLIQAAVSGNRGAFDVLIRQYRRPLLQSIARDARSPAEAEDIVSSAFTIALGQLPQFRGQSSFYTWLFEIALHQLHRRVRRAQPLSLEEISQNDEGWVPPGLIDKDAAMEWLEGRPDREKAKAIVDSVPKADRKLLEMSMLDGIPHEEIARQLKIPMGTVWSRMAKAKKRLREAWKRRTFRDSLVGMNTQK